MPGKAGAAGVLSSFVIVMLTLLTSFFTANAIFVTPAAGLGMFTKAAVFFGMEGMVMMLLFLSIVTFVSLIVTARAMVLFAVSFELDPPPPLLLPLLDEAAVVVVPDTVTLFVSVAVPPGVPEADKLNVHVVADEGAVTDQLIELVPEPVIVPMVFVSEETVHWLLVSVAVTPVDEPAVSVPAFLIVAETVKVELVPTEAGAVIDVTPSSAAELTVMVPQSAVQVLPKETHTSWPPVEVGVIEKSAVPVPPFACMLAIVVDDEEALNHEP